MNPATLTILLLLLTTVFLLYYYTGSIAFQVVDTQKTFSPKSICEGPCIRKGGGVSLHGFRFGIDIKITCERYFKYPETGIRKVHFKYKTWGDGYRLGLAREGVWICNFTEEEWERDLQFTLRSNKRIKNYFGEEIYKYSMNTVAA